MRRSRLVDGEKQSELMNKVWKKNKQKEMQKISKTNQKRKEE